MHVYTANVLSDASGRALGAVTSRYYSVNGLHYDTYSKLYNNLVVPVMDYSSAIWGYKDYNKNNTVQHRAMRTFLGVGKYTAIPALYGELCVHSLVWASTLPYQLYMESFAYIPWCGQVHCHTSFIWRALLNVTTYETPVGYDSSICTTSEYVWR